MIELHTSTSGYPYLLLVQIILAVALVSFLVVSAYSLKEYRKYKEERVANPTKSHSVFDYSALDLFSVAGVIALFLAIVTIITVSVVHYYDNKNTGEKAITSALTQDLGTDQYIINWDVEDYAKSSFYHSLDANSKNTFLVSMVQTDKQSLCRVFNTDSKHYLGCSAYKNSSILNNSSNEDNIYFGSPKEVLSGE